MKTYKTRIDPGPPRFETYLELSADARWMRVIVSDKLTVTFNVEYVKKILKSGNQSNKRKAKQK